MRRAFTILASVLLVAGMMPSWALADSPGATSQGVTALTNKIESLESQLAAEVQTVRQDRQAFAEAMSSLPVFAEEQIDLTQGEPLMIVVRQAIVQANKDSDLQQDVDSEAPVATLRADVLQLTLDLAVLKAADHSVVTLTSQVNGLAGASAPIDDSGALPAFPSVEGN